MAEPSGLDWPDGGAAEPSGPGGGIIERGKLTEEEAAAVLRLAAAAADEDGVRPLSEHVMLHLRYGGDTRARNLVLYDGGELAGYAHLDPTDPVEGPSGELVIHPRLRGRGLGRRLSDALAGAAADRPLRLWAHGDLPGATGLAASAGFERVRSLWQMRRSLQAPLDRPVLAEGITVRTFVLGRDEPDWVELNRRAFARHPEQGAWTRDDLDRRERESWFDPEGFFLAHRDGRLVGFHWTKIHGALAGVGQRATRAGGGSAGGGSAGGGSAGGAPAHEAAVAAGRGPDTDSGAHGHEAIGEVYVVGVDPGERGSGLGRALTLTGLRYLRARGLFQVMLYVDESNTAAIRLYESLGFTHWDTDVMFRHPGSLAGRGGGGSRGGHDAGGHHADRQADGQDAGRDADGPALT
jgi:mycothiol synthase